MNIEPISQNNPNFGKLYSPRKLMMFKTGKVSREQLFKSESIKECAEKYDVIIRRGKENGQIETSRNTFIGAGIGTLIGGIVSAATIVLGAPIALGLFFGAIYTSIATAFGATRPHEAATYNYFVKGKKNDIETKEYLLVTPKDLNNIPNLVQEIEEQQPL